MSDLFDQILGAFGSRQVNAKDLAEDDPMAQIAKECEGLFTAGVDWLRTCAPSDRVRAIARVIWDLVGHKQVVVAIGPEVPSLSFAIFRGGQAQQGVVMVPKGWPKLVQDNMIMQLGAILFVGAQVVDYYNNRLLGDHAAEPRWHAYEAELLLALAPRLPDWTPNDHQRTLLQKYPAGLDSPGLDLYAYRTYEPAQGTA